MTYSAEEDFARQMDQQDSLGHFRERFFLPRNRAGEPLIYFAGNSLGLMPRTTRAAVEQELDDWARLGVDGHFDAATPWYSYHESVRAPAARLAGAQPEEVVCMNSLTVNLHLLMATFYRPTRSRHKLLMEEPAFPSDTYAIKSQIAHHGFQPNDSLVLARPGEGEFAIRQNEIEALIEREGEEIALVLFAGVNFFSGQLFDLEKITAAAQKRGCMVGIDLAHAVGNVPLRLHEWNVDFAVWCSYKYLNSGPGAVGGAFVHERHARDRELPRLAGWWGNDPATRFRMQLEPEFVPVASADAWQLSNPPILAMAPLRTSFAIFDEAGGMEPLRAKSLQLTGYLRFLLDQIPARLFTVITPRPPNEHGSQLSILAHEHPKELFTKLEAAGVKADFREPDVIRVAPTALYNTFHEVWRFARILAQHQ